MALWCLDSRGENWGRVVTTAFVGGLLCVSREPDPVYAVLSYLFYIYRWFYSYDSKTIAPSQEAAGSLGGNVTRRHTAACRAALQPWGGCLGHLRPPHTPCFVSGERTFFWGPNTGVEPEMSAVEGGRWFVLDLGLVPEPEAKQENRQGAENCCWLGRMACNTSSLLCSKSTGSSGTNQISFPASSGLVAPWLFPIKTMLWPVAV